MTHPDSTVVQAQSASGDTFQFTSAVSGPLKSFAVVNGEGTAAPDGDSHLDNLYLSSGAANIRYPAQPFVVKPNASPYAARTSLYLDLNDTFTLKTTGSQKAGFSTFAFHPEFASNGLFYTIHTEETGRRRPIFHTRTRSSQTPHGA